jgi:hypothetical protein
MLGEPLLCPQFRPRPHHPFIAFSSEVDTGSRKENASKQEAQAQHPSALRCCEV